MCNSSIFFAFHPLLTLDLYQNLMLTQNTKNEKFLLSGFIGFRVVVM